VIVQTEEELHFPRAMFGYVVPKVKLLQKGLSNTMSKVDPGYPGPLIITLFNLGKRKVTVHRGDPFCAFVVHDTAEGATLYAGVGKQVAGDKKQRVRLWIRWAHDKLEANHTAILAALVLVGLVEIVIRILELIWVLKHA
jgi:dCTP deaminase